jgi:UDPglucose 6-dehydrogenase
VIFIAVGTPPLETGEANLCYLEAAARGIGAAMDDARFRVVVNKSTVPVGSGNLVETLVREGIRDAHAGNPKSIRFGVASNPEFLREGSAIADSLYPDRIVLAWYRCCTRRGPSCSRGLCPLARRRRRGRVTPSESP